MVMIPGVEDGCMCLCVLSKLTGVKFVSILIQKRCFTLSRMNANNMFSSLV